MAASESAHAASETTCVETAAMKTATSSAECRGWGGFTDREPARAVRMTDFVTLLMKLSFWDVTCSSFNPDDFRKFRDKRRAAGSMFFSRVSG